MDSRLRHQEIGSAWDLVARGKYRAEIEEHIAVLRAGGHNLLPIEHMLLRPFLQDCRRIIHLQCSHGFDALGLLNLGEEGTEVIGVDISAEMIGQAQEKTRALQARASWYHCDVLDVPFDLDRSADLVYTGRGALPWIHDLGAWAAVVARLLRPGGTVFIYEGHPLDNVWLRAATTFAVRSDYAGYFAGHPTTQPGFPASVVERTIGRGRDAPRMLEQGWRPGQVIAALQKAGLSLTHFDEYADRYWDQFPSIPATHLDLLPHTYAVIAQRPEDAASKETRRS